MGGGGEELGKGLRRCLSTLGLGTQADCTPGAEGGEEGGLATAVSAGAMQGCLPVLLSAASAQGAQLLRGACSRG